MNAARVKQFLRFFLLNSFAFSSNFLKTRVLSFACLFKFYIVSLDYSIKDKRFWWLFYKLFSTFLIRYCFYAFIYKNIYPHTHTHTYTHICVFVYQDRLYIHTHTHSLTHTHWLCMYICICICICLHTLTYTQREVCGINDLVHSLNDGFVIFKELLFIRLLLRCGKETTDISYFFPFF